MNRKRITIAGGVAVACVLAVLAVYLFSTVGQGGSAISSAQAAKAINTQAVLKATKWASVVKASYTSTSVVMSTTDIPNHKRASYYAVPDAGVVVTHQAPALVCEAMSVRPSPLKSPETVFTHVEPAGRVARGEVVKLVPVERLTTRSFPATPRSEVRS